MQHTVVLSNSTHPITTYEFTVPSLIRAAGFSLEFGLQLTIEYDGRVVHKLDPSERHELTTPGMKLAIAREIVNDIRGPKRTRRKAA